MSSLNDFLKLATQSRSSDVLLRNPAWTSYPTIFKHFSSTEEGQKENNSSVSNRKPSTSKTRTKTASTNPRQAYACRGELGENKDKYGEKATCRIWFIVDGNCKKILKSEPDICLPGVDIVAPTVMDGDGRVSCIVESGASLSTPIVAGAIGYLKRHHPDRSPATLRSSLMTTGQLKLGSASTFAGPNGMLFIKDDHCQINELSA
ncbi:hypothetical protein RJ640_005067 [Escallonia rubra]|uniref:Peptidase S8/S53 domain-containing protein n=1 Tax=Escallonia rubra TaxID=112253 RepID=A0AA88UEB4_9ASTE|nr:hypothetical protein RJ640_005067 [Escallonia rubra]